MAPFNFDSTAIDDGSGPELQDGLASVALGPSNPFNPDGRFERVAPFALVAVLGALSLALPPGPSSIWNTAIAMLLLVMTAVGVVLPWHRIPRALMVLVPLTYIASVLTMVFATGTSTSGIGILVLVSVIWVALYHRLWESMVVVAAVVVFEVIVSLTPVVAPDAVILRRALFWSLLGTLLSVATHRLRGMAGSQVLAREEDLRRTVALERATVELTAILDPDEVIFRATKLAAELVSPQGTPGRRAQFFRVERDTVTIVAQYDETGEHVTAPFRLDDHPNLLSVYLSRAALSSQVDVEAVGPSVRGIVERLGVTHGVYVPILRGDQVEGIMSVTIRGGRDVPSALFEQCKALGHVIELALANAWAHRDIGQQAITDSMTTLPNRRGFETFVESRPGRRSFVLLAIDVDELKLVNDLHGHDAGDALLVRVAGTMQRALRRGDVLARLGGDEFVAYLVDATESEGRAVAARMLSTLESLGGDPPPGVSIGIAVGAPDDDVHEIQMAADAAMYAAKRSGGRRYELARPDAAVLNS